MHPNESTPQNCNVEYTKLETASFKTPLSVAYEYCKQATPTNNEAPVLMALHGLGSDMLGGKIELAKAWTIENNYGFSRFDYPGHGQSQGEMVDFTISQALDAALHLIDHIIKKPMVLMGSSTGGWLALLLAQARPNKIKGFVTIANACDFTEDLYWQAFSQKQREDITRKGFYEKKFPDGFGFKLGLTLFEDGKNHLLFDGRSPKSHKGKGLADITCPARLLHGTADDAVPWPTSVRVAKELGGENVEVRLIPHADHRFSEDFNKKTLIRAIADVYQDIS